MTASLQRPLYAATKRRYDSNTLAQDMFALMDVLGHQTFAMAGHDIGGWTGYAMAESRHS